MYPMIADELFHEASMLAKGFSYHSTPRRKEERKKRKEKEKETKKKRKELTLLVCGS
jgi:hypothetical protein